MTLKYELTKKLRKKEIVTVCAFSYDEYKNNKRNTLEYKINNEWITIKPPFEYKNYSHGLCIDCIRTNYPTVYEKFMENQE